MQASENNDDLSTSLNYLNSVRKAKPISMFTHPQENLSKKSTETSQSSDLSSDDLSMLLNIEEKIAATTNSSNASTTNTANNTETSTINTETTTTINSIISSPFVLENVVNMTELDIASLNSVKTIG